MWQEPSRDTVYSLRAGLFQFWSGFHRLTCPSWPQPLRGVPGHGPARPAPGRGPCSSGWKGADKGTPPSVTAWPDRPQLPGSECGGTCLRKLAALPIPSAPQAWGLPLQEMGEARPQGAVGASFYSGKWNPDGQCCRRSGGDVPETPAAQGACEQAS